MYYRCQFFNQNGKIIEERHIQISVGTVDDATKNEQVLKLKKKARDQGFAFRVTRCE
jgi:hypothetical protein